MLISRVSASGLGFRDVSGTRVARVAQGTRKAGARPRGRCGAMGPDTIKLVCTCHETSIPVLS